MAGLLRRPRSGGLISTDGRRPRERRGRQGGQGGQGGQGRQGRRGRPAVVAVSHRLILASASPARRRVLMDAGLSAEVIVSGVDEGGVEDLAPADAVLALARRKAQAVAGRLTGSSGALVIGCDSLLEVDGRAHGKPGSAPAATKLWHRLRSHHGTLHTGHCVIDCGTDAEAAATASAVVRFGDPTDQEIAAYVATGEPLGVAGGFTMEGFGAPWVDAIEGNSGTVAGLSLPLLRRLLGDLGVGITELWNDVPTGPALATGDFRDRVEAVLASLAPGEVVSYGDVAAEAGRPGAARAVGRILATPDSGPELPWWRVVTASGRLVPGHEADHARRLTAEGIAIVNGRVSRRRSSAH